MPPAGVRLTDGFPTTIGFANAPGIELWEKEVTPPGYDSGGANDTTTMRNTRWRTFISKKLITLTAMQFTAQYDPKVKASIQNQSGVNQQITVNHSNGGTTVFWGFLDKVVFQRVREGEPPLADVTIQPTNQDNSGAEVAPTYTGPSSTSATTTTTLA